MKSISRSTGISFKDRTTTQSYIARGYRQRREKEEGGGGDEYLFDNKRIAGTIT